MTFGREETFTLESEYEESSTTGWRYWISYSELSNCLCCMAAGLILAKKQKNNYVNLNKPETSMHFEVGGISIPYHTNTLLYYNLYPISSLSLPSV